MYFNISVNPLWVSLSTAHITFCIDARQWVAQMSRLQKNGRSPSFLLILNNNKSDLSPSLWLILNHDISVYIHRFSSPIQLLSPIFSQLYLIYFITLTLFNVTSPHIVKEFQINRYLLSGYQTQKVMKEIKYIHHSSNVALHQIVKEFAISY